MQCVTFSTRNCSLYDPLAANLADRRLSPLPKLSLEELNLQRFDQHELVVEITELSQQLIDAVILTKDSRYRHTQLPLTDRDCDVAIEIRFGQR